MKEKLPVVFRINKLTPNYQVFLDNIKDKDFIKKFIEEKRRSQEEQQGKTSTAVEEEKSKEAIEEEVDQEEKINVEGED